MVKWNKLKGRMFERGITQTDIVKAIGRGVNYVCTRINGTSRGQLMKWKSSASF